MELDRELPLLEDLLLWLLVTLLEPELLLLLLLILRLLDEERSITLRIDLIFLLWLSCSLISLFLKFSLKELLVLLSTDLKVFP